ncbi:MAG: hypothetical protein KKF41_14250 [Actinobacteria bacterium]|nr:hypothetical protein [Actinomycetota bacterium]MBU1942589.1 hypothetical protein [Actinomycetota bacterium]MBU2688735.1 hypothetical protein [Actinomycetota bacterium]
MKKGVMTAAIALAMMLAVGTAVAGGEQPRASYPRSSAAEERQDARSEMLQQRIDLVITRFNNNKERHVATYQAMKAEVQQLISTLAAQGYDVAKITSDLQTWDQMIIKFAQDYVSFINLLEATKAYIPYESEGQFAAALEQARAQLRVCRQDSLDIRLYYQQTIRADIAELASQKPGSTAP